MKAQSPIEIWKSKVAPRLVQRAECHIFTGKKAGKGYGQVWIRGRGHVYTHRMALEIKLGRRLTPKELACHKCDVPDCCNPEHLFAGTAAENSADMVRKGRYLTVYERGFKPLCGESHPRARLKKSQVDAIRAMYAAGGITQQTIADRFSVSRQYVGEIVSGKKWSAAA